MYVDAEIMEDDLDRVRVGREVTIRSNVLDGGEASGTVEKIGYLIGSRETFVTDPTAFTDSRIVHVKIRVADAARFERFINARVTVEIR
jgi:HlyD family secretion protein